MMGIKLEQEVKFYLNNLDSLEKKLKSLGAKLEQPRTPELNLRFDTNERSLSSSFQVLRLRQDTRARLTYKSASDPQREVSAREELEVEVGDLKTAQAILEALGFEVIVMYEKYRAAYLLDAVEISLDETPLGTFCEIEGPDTASIKNCAGKLNLDWKAHSKMSYLALFDLVKKNLNLDADNLDFESFKDVEVTAGDLGMRAGDENG
jgi:adenylate cyclase class 2